MTYPALAIETPCSHRRNVRCIYSISVRAQIPQVNADSRHVHVSPARVSTRLLGLDRPWDPKVPPSGTILRWRRLADTGQGRGLHGFAGAGAAGTAGGPLGLVEGPGVAAEAGVDPAPFGAAAGAVSLDSGGAAAAGLLGPPA